MSSSTYQPSFAGRLAAPSCFFAANDPLRTTESLLFVLLSDHRGKKYHYFLFDFCYYANIFVLLYIHFFPKSETMFIICFAFCTGSSSSSSSSLLGPQPVHHLTLSLPSGPLAWSVLAWRNSLVFHSLDKTTSLFIHLTPNILLYALRWLDEDPDRFDSLELDSCACVRATTHWLPGCVLQSCHV